MGLQRAKTGPPRELWEFVEHREAAAELPKPSAHVRARDWLPTGTTETKVTSVRFVPAVCDVSVTNACNATCNFCSYAYDKKIVKNKRWLDRADFARAL